MATTWMDTTHGHMDLPLHWLQQWGLCVVSCSCINCACLTQACPLMLYISPVLLTKVQEGFNMYETQGKPTVPAIPILILGWPRSWLSSEFWSYQRSQSPFQWQQEAHL